MYPASLRVGFNADGVNRESASIGDPEAAQSAHAIVSSLTSPDLHRCCPLKLTEGNAVLFAPFDRHLPKFDLLKPIPGVPQVIFRK
jgi:hypothetical protein